MTVMEQVSEMPAPTNEEYLRSIKRYTDDEKMTAIRNKLEEAVRELPEELREAALASMFEATEKTLAAACQKKCRAQELLGEIGVLPPHRGPKDPLGLANDATLLDDAGLAAKAKRDKAIIECMRLLLKKMDVEAKAPYTALEHYDAVYQASLDQWPNPDTWVQMMIKVLQFYDIVGIDRQPLC